MKSVLHEASSILKAIEKAWEASGKPSEFNVKVLEQGEKKLWVFTSKPAIVSISFDQKHVARTFKTTPQNNRFNKRSQAHSNNGATTQEKLLNGTSTPQLEAVTKNNVRSRQNQQRHQNANQQSQAKNQRQQPALRQQNQQSLAPVNEQQAQKQPRPTNQIIGWTPELVQFVAKELKDFLTL
ncbi:hypothetical protein FJ364_00455 [Candidatus Dependentiae bacterium]|nr:hypothetical protein [Candidatus Dependentiae bacterium]